MSELVGNVNNVNEITGVLEQRGPKGETGQGVKEGGTTGQFLRKASNTDYDTEWANAVGLTDYNDLSNRPQINNVVLTGNKTLQDLGISNFSGNYNDLTNKPTIPSKTSDLTNDSGFVDNSVNNLTNYTKTSELGTLATKNSVSYETEVTNKPNLTVYSLISETVNKFDLSIDSSTYVITINLKDKNNNVISTGEVDLPLESVVVSGSYDAATKNVILTLKNGATIEFSIADLVSGLQSEITSSNKLSSDLVDDTNNTNKFVTSQEKTNWNNKSDFSGNYNDLSNKPTIPTKTSDLTNDSNFATTSYVDNIVGNINTTLGGI